MKKINYKILKVMAFSVVMLFMSSSVFAQVQENQQDTTTQDTTTQMDDQQQTMPQEQYQRTGDDMQGQDPDEGVNYSETIEQSELPQEVNSSLDELYPAHKIQEAYRGEDDSYKIKVKNETDEAFVYYDSQGDFLRAHNLSGLQQDGAMPQEQGQRTQTSEDMTGKDMDKGVDYSETIQKGDLPQEISSSVDSLYPAHQIAEVFRGDDDSYKVKVKNENDVAVVYYDSQEDFLRAENLTKMQKKASPQEQSQRVSGTNDFDSWDSDNDKQISESEFSDGLFSQGKNDAGLFDDDDKDSKGLSEIGSEGKNDAGLFDDDDKDSKGLSEIGSEGKNDAGLFDDDDKDSKGLSEIGAEGKNDSGIFDSDDKNLKGLSESNSEIGYDDDTFYETSYDWWDTNNDQQLDENEWDFGYENSFGDYMDDDFDAYDINQDDYLSYDEYYDSVYETDYFSEWDSNNDDILDNDEYSAGIFDTWDANDDNYLDENEYNELSLVVVDLRAQQNQDDSSAYPQEQSQRMMDDMHSKMHKATEYSEKINKSELPDAVVNSIDEAYPDNEISEVYRGKDDTYKVKLKIQDDESVVYINDKGELIRGGMEEHQQASPQEMNQRIEDVEESQDADRWGTDQRTPDYEEGQGADDEERFEDNWGPENMGAHQTTWKDGEGYPQEQSQRTSGTDDFFDSWDSDSDSQLSETELEEGLSEIDSEIGYDEDEFYETSYDWWDADDDQRLDETEWNTGYENSYGDYLEDDFDTYDTNQDGYLSYDEYYDSVYESDYYSDWDSDNDGVLDYDEYSVGLFDTLDADDDDYIDENEYKELGLVVVDLRVQQNQKEGSAYPQEQSQQATDDDDMENEVDQSTWMGGEGTDTTQTPSRIDTTAVYKNQWEEGTFEEGDDTASPQEQNQQATDDDELEDQSTWMGGEGTDTTSTPSRIDTTAVYKNQWEEGTFEEGDDTATPQEQYQQTDEWGDADTTDMQGEYGTTPTDTTDTSYNDQMMEDNTLDQDDTASPQEQYQATGDTDDVDYSEEIQENELPESVTSSLDELYPEYEMEKAYRGDDGSYKVKIKNNEDKLAVYYDSDGLFYRDEVLDDMLEDDNKDTNQDW